MKPRGEAVLAFAVCAAAIVVKLALILTSQRALDADEAILGLMAIHIQNGTSHPLFFYGQSYDAGAGILAHILAVAFQIFGVSIVAMKLVGLAVWLSVTAAAVVVVRAWIGWRPAALAAMLMLWAPTSVEWAMKARGGQMLAVLFVVATVGLALRGSGSIAVGAAAAAAVWVHPSALPAVALPLAWVVIRFVSTKQFRRLAFVVLGMAIVSAIPIAAIRTADTAWSWQAFTVADTHRDPGLLFGRVLPALFTPEVDWSIPPPPLWVKAVGYVWLAAFAASCVYVVREFGRTGGLLAATAIASMAAMFMVDSQTVTARLLLPLYPLACMIIAALRFRFAMVVTVALVLSGIAVHAASFGPAEIHGAGEQQRRIRADVVDAMVQDLDRHGVQCVFSQSPMLQWNLMFASRERIAARWVAPRDRWQPYVERVNEAFHRGDRCAILLWKDGYAFLYDPPRQLIIDQFKFSPN